MNKFRRIVWPALSFTSIYFFANLSCYLIISFKSSYNAYMTTASLNLFILPTMFVFFSKTDLNQSLWKIWISFPTHVHKLIVLIMFIILIPLVSKALPVALRKNYEKD